VSSISAIDIDNVHQRVPEHVAIIMDGNGRWARQRGLPRTAGHRAGAKSVRSGVKVLTLFAFSSENWRRPPAEVSVLMELFMSTLQAEVKRLVEHEVRLRIIGDLSAFSPKLQERFSDAQHVTRHNDRLILQVAANYGGRWDITRAARSIAAEVAAGTLRVGDVDEAAIASRLSFPNVPDPDLFIRTGGEKRISNFLLWQSAYAELYFSDLMWPEFDAAAYVAALNDFARRQRRFGRTGEQVIAKASA